MALIMKYIDSMQRWMDTYGGKYTAWNWRIEVKEVLFNVRSIESIYNLYMLRFSVQKSFPNQVGRFTDQLEQY